MTYSILLIRQGPWL